MTETTTSAPVELTPEERIVKINKEFTALKLSKDVLTLLGKISSDEKSYFVGLTEEARELLLEEFRNAATDNEKLKDLDLVQNLFEDDKGHTFNLGEFMFRKGMTFTAQFLGMRYLFSKKPLDHWIERISPDGSNTLYMSSRFEFRMTDGKIVNLWPSSMLRNQLRNILTRSSGSDLTCDPTVSITYDGKVKIEVAKSVYDFEASDISHATTIKFDKESVKFGAGRGCLNPLNSPEVRDLIAYDEDMESEDITVENFNRLDSGRKERMAIADQSVATAAIQ